MIHTEERSIHSLTCTFCYWFFKQKYNLIWKTFIRRNLLHSFLRSFDYLLACLLACYFFAFLLGKRTQFTRTQTNPQTFWFNPNIIGSVVSSSFVSYFRPFWYFFSLRLFIAIHIRVYPISPSCWVHIAQHIAHCNIIIVTCVLAIAAAATSLVYIGQILLIHLFMCCFIQFFFGQSAITGRFISSLFPVLRARRSPPFAHKRFIEHERKWTFLSVYWWKIQLILF